MAYKEYDRITTAVAIEGEDVLDSSVRYSIPAGHPGIITYVHAGGRAYEVDITLGSRGHDGVVLAPRYCQVTLRDDQIRPEAASASGPTPRHDGPGLPVRSARTRF